MDTANLDDLMDRLVAEFADRAQASSNPEKADLLEQVPVPQRQGLERCFRMIELGMTTAPRASSALAPGREIDGYRLLNEIGRGGMAVVYLAQQIDLKRPVALKFLRPGLAVDSLHVDRFRREGLAIAKLKHPNIVQVYSVGEADGHHYIAMEYVDGTNLAKVYANMPLGRAESWTAADLAQAAGIEVLAEGHASFERAFAALLAPVARAIGLAHELGLVHRDVKPSNILIHKDGRAVIADFGLAKGDEDPGLSLTGEPLGTPSYMSPEQAALTSFKVDQRTDVYSLGVTMYEGLTGTRPFPGENLMAVLESIRNTVPPPLRSAVSSCTRDAEAVARRAMERDPAKRYANCLDLSTELVALAEGRATQARAQEGGLIARARRAVGQNLVYGRQGEYKSSKTFLGLPLFHVFVGPRASGQGFRVARGWFAAGGELSIGGVAFGPLALGGFTWGGLSMGLFCFGGMALGAVAVGGMAAGILAHGGMAIGYGAFGGMAYGYYAMGGRARGAHTIDGSGVDPVAQEWFESLGGLYQWMMGWYDSGG